MKICVFTICKNEAAFMPFFLRHYSSFADKIIVWDEASDDGTRDIVKACPKAELRNWMSRGLDDYKFKAFSEEAYKEARGHFDWCIWVDVDEIIWAPDILSVFRDSIGRFDVIDTRGFNMANEGLPADDGRQIWEILPLGADASVYAKKCVFNPAVDITWSTGKHHIEKQGTIRISPPYLKLLHYRFLGEIYTRKRNARNYEANVDKGHAWTCAPEWKGAHSPDYAKELLGMRFNVLEAPLYYEPFDGDVILNRTIRGLIKDNGIQTVIETGTRDGSTALVLASMVTHAYSIEFHLPFLIAAQKRAKQSHNLIYLYGDSGQVLSALLPHIPKPLLVFLDAHAHDSWPLHNELRALKGYRDVWIVVHDVKLPGTTLGFDSYGGQDLTVDFFIDLIPPIYGNKFKWWTNDESAEGARRGVFFAAPDLLCTPR